jgi:hypothetical protein
MLSQMSSATTCEPKKRAIEIPDNPELTDGSRDRRKREFLMSTTVSIWRQFHR